MKNDMQLSEVVDGSNESLYYRNEELDPNLRKGLPLQKSFEKVDLSVRKENEAIRNPTPYFPFLQLFHMPCIFMRKQQFRENAQNVKKCTTNGNTNPMVYHMPRLYLLKEFTKLAEILLSR